MFTVKHWCNVLSLKTFDQLGLNRAFQSSKTNLMSYGGHKGKPVGKHNTAMQISKSCK